MITSDAYLKILSTPSFHIPVEANFIVGINNVSTIAERVTRQLNTISGNKLTLKGYETILTNPLLKNELFFATGVTLPGESISDGRVGFSAAGVSVYGGLLSSPILKGRKDLSNFQIALIETNQSFIDYVMRPWIVAVSHFGLFARGEGEGAQNQNFKTTVTVNFLDRTEIEKDTDKKIRKSVTFFNAAPLSVDGYETSYGNNKSTGVRFAKTTWTYSNYSVS